MEAALALLAEMADHNFIGVDEIAQLAFGSNDRQTRRKVRDRIDEIAHHTGLESASEVRHEPLRNGGHNTYRLSGLRVPGWP